MAERTPEEQERLDMLSESVSRALHGLWDTSTLRACRRKQNGGPELPFSALETGTSPEDVADK